MKRLALFASLLALACCAFADKEGMVIRVTDGDSITIEDKMFVRSRVRLWGIDAPEYSQPYGRSARLYLSRMVRGVWVKVVDVEGGIVDRWGRIVGKVYVPSRFGVNYEMVRSGYAWWFEKYAPRDKRLRSLERQARKYKRGLWAAEVTPIAPWIWRKTSNQTGGL